MTSKWSKATKTEPSVTKMIEKSLIWSGIEVLCLVQILAINTKRNNWKIDKQIKIAGISFWKPLLKIHEQQ